MHISNTRGRGTVGVNVGGVCCGGWGFGIEEGTFRSVQIRCDKLIFQPGHLRRSVCVLHGVLGRIRWEDAPPWAVLAQSSRNQSCCSFSYAAETLMCLHRHIAGTLFPKTFKALIIKTIVRLRFKELGLVLRVVVRKWVKLCNVVCSDGTMRLMLSSRECWSSWKMWMWFKTDVFHLKGTNIYVTKGTKIQFHYCQGFKLF